MVTPPPTTTPFDSADSRDALCDAFENQCRQGRIGRIEDYLSKIDEVTRGELFEDLLAIEIWHRRRLGQSPVAGEFEARFPQHLDLIRRVCSASPALTRAAQNPQHRTTSPPLVSSSQSQLLDHPQLRPGVTLGDYEIQRELGRGGMGVVYLAEHRLMKREVAIKVLSAAATFHPDLVTRFLREVETAARLSHPNIVIAHDAHQIDGLLFLVLEYVPGVDLSTYIQQNQPLSPKAAVLCILQAARGLVHAHNKQVIHRDIKPHNLLYIPPTAPTPGELPTNQGTQHGTVKILDMGLARANWANSTSPSSTSPSSTSPSSSSTADLRLTKSHTLMGTVDYMSPEQALDPRQADARSDIYSLGCALHFLLTGQPPFVCETVPRGMQAHRQQPPPRLDLAVDEWRIGQISGEKLNSTFARMLAKRPEDRFQTMAEVVRALKDCLPVDPAAPLAPREEISIPQPSPKKRLAAEPVLKPVARQWTSPRRPPYRWKYTWTALLLLLAIVVIFNACVLWLKN